MIIFNTLYSDLIFYILLLCAFIPVWVFLLLGWQVFGTPMVSCQEGENDTVELIWTVFPTLLVGGLCLFNCQCLGNELFIPEEHVVKVVGRQWYWSYETSGETAYDSTINSFIGSVDKPLRLIFCDAYRILVTSSDVIHSFVLPVLGIKVDAIPGRVNQVSLLPDRVGVFVGYCSELCGAGHAYMPIVAEVVTPRSK